MIADVERQGVFARLKAIKRITFVDVILWSLRILVVVVVVGYRSHHREASGHPKIRRYTGNGFHREAPRLGTVLTVRGESPSEEYCQHSMSCRPVKKF